MKRYGYKWIDFLSGNNVIKVTNEKEFNKFKRFLEGCGLVEILGKDTSYFDWQDNAFLNEKNEYVFLFEYNNYKGLTWWDNENEAKDWYEKEPIEVDDLDEFFNNKTIKKEDEIDYEIN